MEHNFKRANPPKQSLEERTPRSEMYLHYVENHLPIRGLYILNTATYMYKAGVGTFEEI